MDKESHITGPKDHRDIVEMLDDAPPPATDRERSEALWMLLDHIDTLDDACRSDDAAFRKRARRFLHRRHAILESVDGQTLRVPRPEPSEAPTEAPAES